MANRIDAARVVGPAIAPRPEINLGQGTPALDPSHSVQPEFDQQGSSGGFGRGQQVTPIESDEDNDQDNPVVSDARHQLGLAGRDLNFKTDQKTGDLIVQVKDSDSGKVVRQFPADEILRLQQQLERVAGILFHQAA